MVTEQGIEVNPEKIEAYQQMQSLRNLKDVQRLMGRITALSHFISHSVDRNLPFFQVLKKARSF